MSYEEDGNIIVSQIVDCEACDEPFDVDFDTGATDEDGLADLTEDDLTKDVKCPACGEEFETSYTGWMSYGEA